MHPRGGIRTQGVDGGGVTRPAALICFLSLCMAACVPFFGSKKNAQARLEGRYTTQHPGEHWGSVDPGGADRAWWHDVTGATLYTDSNCGKSYSDSSLSRLASAQAEAIDDAILEESKEFRLVGRAAYVAKYGGQVDGVAVTVTTTVVKKRKCIYDFVLIAPVRDNEQVHQDYDALVASFRIKK